MTEKYHCTPLELDRQPAHTVELHKEFMKLEAKRDRIEDQRRRQRAKN